MSKYIRWIYIFNKRIWKDIAFVFIVVFIPLVIFLFFSVLDEKSGMLSIAVASDKDCDDVAGRVIDSLINDDYVINFSEAEDENTAKELLRRGDVDAAWIIPGNLAEKISGFLDGKDEGEPIFMIYENEDNVFLGLTHERLFAEIFSDLIYEVYAKFIKEKLALDVPEETIREAYLSELTQDSLFEFELVSGKSADDEGGYLVAPLNGLLSLIILVVGMTMMMKVKSDGFKGNMVKLNGSERFLYMLFMCLVPLLWVALDVIVFLTVFGFLRGPEILGEMFRIILYILMVVAFCYFVSLLIKNVQLYCCVFIFIIISSLVTCPILININIPVVKYIYPSYLYLMAGKNPAYVLWMTVYCVILFGVAVLSGKLIRKISVPSL